MHRFKIDAFSCEELQNYADELEDEQLESFIQEIEKNNFELEDSVNKKIVVEKNKKNNLKIILRRIWLNLKEEEKREMASFFKEIDFT